MFVPQIHLIKEAHDGCGCAFVLIVTRMEKVISSLTN